MTPSQTKSNLVNIINTLNTIEVKGKENMNRMLGCILLLEKMAHEAEQNDEPEIKLEEVSDGEAR